MEMIKTQDLAFTYPGTEDQVNTRALRGVDVTIERGSFVVILGHNGSGKSTLAKTFNAVLLPSGGKVYVEGMDTMDESLLLEIRRRVGMVFQNPDNQIVANVVEEDVAFAPENLGVPSAEIRKRVDDALEAVGMTQFVKHAPHLLSGGQKQRIAIAGVLAMKPECIVLDEATAMLDPIGRREVLAAVEKLNREQGITVVGCTDGTDLALLLQLHHGFHRLFQRVDAEIGGLPVGVQHIQMIGVQAAQHRKRDLRQSSERLLHQQSCHFRQQNCLCFLLPLRLLNRW